MGTAFSCPGRHPPQHDESSKEAAALSARQYWSEATGYWSDQWLPALANTIECYQFAIYGNMEPYISQTIFGGSDTLSWLVYGTPFLMRTLGGLIFGTIADRYGRRPAILATLMMMFGATIGQGCTPTTRYLGAIWFTTCRIMEAIAFGGEVSSVTVFLAEQSNKHLLTISGTVTLLGVQWGAATSSLLALTLTTLLGDDQMLRWGWRIPFLLVAIPGSYTIWAAQAIPESSAFEEMQQNLDHEEWSLSHQIEMVKAHWLQIALTTSAITVNYATAYLAGTYLQEWLSTYCGASSVTAFWVIFAGQFLSVPFTLPFAYFGDFYGVGKLSVLNSSMVFITVIPMYTILYMYPNSMALTIVFGVLFPAAAQGATVVDYPLSTTLFPTEIRATCSSICCNIACLVGGLAPAICSSTGIPLFLAYYTFFFSGISLLSSIAALSIHYRYKETGQGVQISHLRDLF